MNCNHRSITPSEYAVAPARLAPYTHTPTGDYLPDDDDDEDSDGPVDDYDDDDTDDGDTENAVRSHRLPAPSPTAERPGSDEKVAVLADRYHRGVDLWHNEDTTLLGERAYEVFDE